MRVSLALIFTASLVSASALFKRQTTIPSCATPCLTSSDPSPCSPTDELCLCVNQAYTNATTECVTKACSPEDVTSAEAANEALCKAAGVDPKNPFPSCTEACLQKADPGSCSLNDFSCLCRNPEYLQAADICVHSTCNAQDAAATEPAAQAVCRAVGVDITANAGAHPSGSASATGGATSATGVVASASSATNTATSLSANKNAAVADFMVSKALIVGGLAAFIAAFGL
ncbi:hypothetical protein FRC04_005776 [Tulasnella sp. 424]|nr:hypothetical protein FRC04_005776 [Tulasnella sp. 424]KAG8961903.1 hypothetical protein FRC05_005655 [Tulasnella sp. 425]